MMSVSPNSMLLSRYLLRGLVGPFVFSLCTLMFLFLLQFVMKFVDQLVGKGLTAWVIVELIALNLAWMVVLAVPMSVLVASLMAFGELSARNEITAMKASGVSIYRMVTPVLFTATILAVLLILFNNRVLPEANHRAKTLAIDIRRKKPTLTMVQGLFSQDISGYSILVRKTFEKSNNLEGITLYDYTDPNMNVVITAERGAISFSPDFRKLIMDLQSGEIHELDLTRMSAYRRIRFENHRIAMNVEGFDFERTAAETFSRGDRELSANAMRIVVDSLRRDAQRLEQALRDSITHSMNRMLAGTPHPSPQTGFRQLGGQQSVGEVSHVRMLSSYTSTQLSQIDYLRRQMDQYLVEIHKKYSIPAACIVFVLVGVPLGIMSKRGGFGIAATLSMGFFLLYWAFLIGGEKLADRTLLSPFWGMWSANIIIGMMGTYLTIRVGRENVVIEWSRLRALIPRRLRAASVEEPISPDSR